jgi:uncharacterized membrane protein
MAAHAVDLGALYQTQAELQRTADGAALAAAARLVGAEARDPDDPNATVALDPVVAATDAAPCIAVTNTVLHEAGSFDADSDIEFGRAVFTPVTGRFEFQSGGDNFDSVRVTIRRTSGSAAGPESANASIDGGNGAPS